MFSKFSIILVLIALVLTSIIPLSVIADEVSYPQEINGYPVIFIQTPENTYGLKDCEVILTLLDNANKTIEESFAKLNISEYLNKNPLPKGWNISVYGGNGATKENFEKAHQANQEQLIKFAKENQPWFSGRGTIQNIDFTVDSRMKQANFPTFSICANTDPSSQVVTSQRARLVSMVVGANQDWGSYFLVNGMTDVGRYFLQAGQLYIQGTGWNIWTDTALGLYPQFFAIPYAIGHVVKYDICYSYNVWSIWCEDMSTGTFEYYFRTSATGTKLIRDGHTSVWFENWNSNADWYQVTLPHS
ncbi:MAG: hypothetical protein WC370_00745 [Dehalococcoidales bacterium]